MSLVISVLVQSRRLESMCHFYPEICCFFSSLLDPPAERNSILFSVSFFPYFFFSLFSFPFFLSSLIIGRTIFVSVVTRYSRLYRSMEYFLMFLYYLFLSSYLFQFSRTLTMVTIPIVWIYRKNRNGYYYAVFFPVLFFLLCLRFPFVLIGLLIITRD